MKKCVIVQNLPGTAQELAKRLNFPLIEDSAAQQELMRCGIAFLCEEKMPDCEPFGYWPIVIRGGIAENVGWKRCKEGSFLTVDAAALHMGTLYSWLHEELYS